MTRPRVRWRAAAGYLAWLLLATALLLALAEGALRLAGVRPPQPERVAERFRKFRPDPELIWSLQPSWSGFEVNGAPVRVNALGLRGPAPADEAAARVLFLGDSVTFGHFLGEGDTIPARLEEALRALRGAPVEVLNAGVPGYSTFQSEVFFRERGRALAPDLVLLGFCLNDVTERYTTVARYGGERVFMRTVDTAAGLSWWRRAWTGSALRTAIVRARRAAAERAEAYRLERLWAEPEPPEIAAAWSRVFGEIDRLAAAAADADAAFAVVVFPYASQLEGSERHDGPQRRLRAHLRARGVPVLDLLEAVRASGLARRELFLDANHFRPAGAALVARRIADFVERRGLLAAVRRDPPGVGP